MQPTSPFSCVRALAVALTGVLVLAAANPVVAAECRVRFTEVLHEPYQSGGRQMHRLVLIGDHNYSTASNTGGAATTDFRIVDGDGFLTLAILATRWSGNGWDNPSASAGEARVSRAEVESLRYAMAMGRAYYTRLLAIISTEPRPVNFADTSARIAEKQALISEVLRVLGEARGYRASDDTLVVDMAWMRQQLARFHDGGDMRSQYRDHLLGNGGPNLLCSPTAASPVVGLLACAGVANAQVRPPCPQGLVFDPLLVRPPET